MSPSMQIMLMIVILTHTIWGVPTLYAKEESQAVSTADWVRLLRQGSVEERIQAAQAIGEMKAIEAIDDLGQALQDHEPKVRYHVIRALANLRDPKIEPYIGEALTDPESTNRMEAYRILFAYYLGEPVSAGLHQVKNLMLFRPMHLAKTPWKKVDLKVVASLRNWLRGNDETWKLRAVEAIEHLWIYDLVGDLPPLLQEEDTSKTLTLAIFRTLGSLMACRELRGLLSWIQHPDKKVMDHSVWAFAQCGEREPTIRDAVFQAYGKETDVERQRVLYRSMAQIGEPRAIKLFLQGLGSPDALIRRWSAEGLGRAHDANHTYEIALAFLQETNPLTRLGLSYALFLLGRKEHAVLFIQAIRKGGELRELASSLLLETPQLLFPEIFRLMGSTDEATQLEILKIASLSDSKELIPYLEQMLNEKNEKIAVQAFEALKQVREAVTLRADYVATP